MTLLLLWTDLTSHRNKRKTPWSYSKGLIFQCEAVQCLQENVVGLDNEGTLGAAGSKARGACYGAMEPETSSFKLSSRVAPSPISILVGRSGIEFLPLMGTLCSSWYECADFQMTILWSSWAWWQLSQLLQYDKNVRAACTTILMVQKVRVERQTVESSSGPWSGLK